MKHFLSLTFVALLTSSVHADDLTDDLVKVHERAIAALQEAPKLVDSYKPKVSGNITELATDAAAILKQLPFVKSVEIHKPEGKPTHRIIMFANWHTVSRDLLTEDIEDQTGKKLDARDSFGAYCIHLLEVETVQEEILAMTRCLIREHGLKAVCNEGLTDDQKGKSDIEIYLPTIKHLQKVYKDNGYNWSESYKERNERLKTKPEIATVEQLQKIMVGKDAAKWLILEAGPMLSLVASDELKTVHPIEDAKALDAAAPQFEDGKPLYDPKALEAREDAIVRNTLKHGPVAILLLGGSHDLRDNLKRIEPGAELIVVKVKAYSEFAE